MRPISDFLGMLVNGLRIVGLSGRDAKGEPVFVARCERCGTSGTLTYRKVAQGNAACTSSICNRPTVRAGQSATVKAITGEITGSARSEASRAEFDKQQQRPATVLPMDSQAQWAMRERQKSQARMAAQEKRIQAAYLEYKRRAIVDRGLGLGQLVSLDIWRQMGDSGRERVLEKLKGNEREN